MSSRALAASVGPYMRVLSLPAYRILTTLRAGSDQVEAHCMTDAGGEGLFGVNMRAIAGPSQPYSEACRRGV